MPTPPRLRSAQFALVPLVAALATISCNESTAPASACAGAQRNRINSFPLGWGGGAPTGYTLGIDRGCRHAGATGGFLASTTPNPAGFTTLTQSIKADDFRGKRVRWKGWVRSDGVVNYGGLWMRVDGPGETQAFDNSFTHPIKGTSEWKQVEVVLDIRETAIGISFGILLTGGGDIVVDDLVMEVVPMSVPSTDTYLTPVPNDIPASQTQAQYATRPAKGVNFDFEGMSLASLVAEPASAWMLSSLPPQRGRPIR
jgi:hypothetical protein